MDPASLVASSHELGLPAPFWFIMLFKVLGFILHLIPMSLWFTGILLAMLMRLSGKNHAHSFSNRLMKQMPVIIAYGVNFGIVPLLFIQVVYYKVFYPATILMAWPWLMVIVLLIFSYYGTYVYVVGLKREEEETVALSAVRRAAGWISAVLFILIGFIFSNALSMMTNLHDWPAVWKGTTFGGAVTGTALNTGDLTLWPRWLMVFGLAVMVTAVYTLIDAILFAKRSSDDYKKWVSGFSFWVYTVGMVVFAAMGAWYVFGNWLQPVRETMLNPPFIILTATSALSPGLVWLLLLIGRNRLFRSLAVLAGVAQFVVIALNAVSRQIVQNIELAQFFDPAGEQVNIQWSPLILFLIFFVAGLLVVFWMIRKIMEVHPETVN